MSFGRDRGSTMDRMVASILRPWGASFVGAFVVLCGVLHGGNALAASGTPLLQPDAPPAGAVVAPAPDPPTADAPASVVGAAPTFRRPTLRAQSGTGGRTRRRRPGPPAGRSSPLARPGGAREPAEATVGRPAVPAARASGRRRGLRRCSDHRGSGRRPRSGRSRARGHAARDRHARRRLPDSGRRQGCTGGMT